MGSKKPVNRLEMENLKIRKKMGEKLKKARVQAGYTQDQVADKFKYETSQFVSNFERGECLPPKKILKGLAKLYNIDERGLLKEFIDCEVKLIRNLYKQEFDIWD